jgi:DUF438 domain-containing protein
MEPLKNQETLNAIHKFMSELEDKNAKLSKPQIYRKYEDVLSQISPLDLFYLPMYQNNTSFSIDEIKDTAGKFVNVFYHGLEQHKPSSYDSLFFQYLIQENRAIETHLNQLKPYFKKNNLLDNIKTIHSTLEACYELEKKYIKKELILFPRLEQRLPSTKPLEVLWSLHDDARHTLRVLLRELQKDIPTYDELIYLIGEYYNLVYGINTKDELILYPVANQMLNPDEKQDMYQEALEYGFVFIDDLPEISSETTIRSTLSNGYFQSKTGHLNIEQLEGLMQYIPIDITFVDDQDKVSYFNDRKERHFPRNPSIIGRLVKHCHPPKSVHIVEKIVNAFKTGLKDNAEFWIQFNDVFLYITYYAVRNKQGKYIGTLEVSQDVTHIKTLQGEQRLLDWE